LRSPRLLAATFLLLLLPALAGAQPAGDARLLRYPDIHGDTIAFVYAGDIWVVGAGGGLARRLTSHAGLELFPKFSPDGKWITFSGEYGGNRQVYVISVEGGTPRQLTFHNDIGDLPPRAGYDNQVLGWTPDGKEIVFRAHRVPYSGRLGRPYTVPFAGGMEQPIRVPEGGNGTLSPDGTRFVYTPTQTEYRGWKRYQGGQAQDLWIYDLRKDTAERITDYPGTDNQPLWIGDKIYFTSDREGGRLNLFVHDLATRAVRKLTSHDRYDVLWPSGRDRIVYENGGAIYLYDPAAGGASRRVPIRVGGDLPQTLPYFKKMASNVESGELSPTGKRAVLVARGDVFTVPAEKGEILNLTASPGVRERAATWSPDGRWVAYLSDRTGEYEVWVRASDGAGEERQVTNGGEVWRFGLAWSPDSKKIAFGDTNRKLRYVEVASGRLIDADVAERGPINDYRWSPDSRLLVYTKPNESFQPAIWVYSLDEGKAHQLSDGLTSDYEPVFSRDGRYLYFLSDRDFNLTFSNYEFDYLYTDPTRLYVGILSQEGPALLLPESDDEAVAAAVRPEPGAAPGGGSGTAATPASSPKSGREAGEEAGKPDAVAKSAPPRTKIDYDGFSRRVRALPVKTGAYASLNVNADGIFYLSGRPPHQEVRMFNMKDRKDKAVLEGIDEYALSADGAKLLYHKGESWGIVDARPGQKSDDGKLALDAMEMEVHPREEWRQMFVDAWRIMRDWFYDPNMNGIDWKAMRERYGELLPYLANRDDLDFLLSEMGGEISAGHIYVARGDEPGPQRVEGGLLGAEIAADPSGYYRIAHIFPGENWAEETRSPLTESGVHATAGDYILAVDGHSTKGVDNFYRLLENRAGHVVKLLINDKPAAAGAHEERVRPVKSEQRLRYLEWVQANRERVDRASGGKIGYIHLPDTAVAGNRELFKGFYEQSRKQALILDDRYNGGGFIPDRMIDLLRRPLLSYWVTRSGVANTTPGFVNTGPKACLINGIAGSGGDAFPYYFRKLGMGPLIGTRTWGGLIGLSGNPSLLDGGQLSTPAYRFLDTAGKWDVEGIGVAPDIEVVDRPDEVAKGHDPSLERAVAYLMEELRKHPQTPVKVPPPPRQPAVP
jgi:tricorn protease